MRFVKLSVSNLDKNVTTKDLEELFSEYADVRKITIHTCRGHKSEKYAHLEIKGRQGAENLVKLFDWKQWHRRTLRVMYPSREKFHLDPVTGDLTWDPVKTRKKARTHGSRSD